MPFGFRPPQLIPPPDVMPSTLFQGQAPSELQSTSFNAQAPSSFGSIPPPPQVQMQGRSSSDEPWWKKLLTTVGPTAVGLGIGAIGGDVLAGGAGGAEAGAQFAEMKTKLQERERERAFQAQQEDEKHRQDMEERKAVLSQEYDLKSKQHAIEMKDRMAELEREGERRKLEAEKDRASREKMTGMEVGARKAESGASLAERQREFGIEADFRKQDAERRQSAEDRMELQLHLQTLFKNSIEPPTAAQIADVTRQFYAEKQARGEADKLRSLGGMFSDITPEERQASPSLPPPPGAGPAVGTRKTFPNGRVGVWDGKGWVAQ